MWSKERNAGASTVIKSRKDEAATARSSAYSRRLWKIPAFKIPWNNRNLKPSKDRVESHRKQEAVHWTSLSDSLAMRNCPRVVPANSTCVVIAGDPSQETADELYQ